VRNTKDPAKVHHLTSLAGAAERLTLHEADMLNGPENFVPIFKGCTYVMHTACPFVFGNKAAELGEDFFVTPAVKGTLDVLEATRTAQGVQRVVLTSSMMAVIKKVADPLYIYDVNDWNDVEELRPRKAWCVPYSFSSIFLCSGSFLFICLFIFIYFFYLLLVEEI
jgi:nucleoside-diphosphate-sugar epimerase